MLNLKVVLIVLVLSGAAAASYLGIAHYRNLEHKRQVRAVANAIPTDEAQKVQTYHDR